MKERKRVRIVFFETCPVCKKDIEAWSKKLAKINLARHFEANHKKKGEENNEH